MNPRGRNSSGEMIAAPKARPSLFRKYITLFATVVCLALITNRVFDIWFSSQEQRALLTRVQRVQADSAAHKISQFLKEVEGQLAWATQLPWSAETLDEWNFDAVRLLSRVPAVTEVVQLDAAGREQASMSRLDLDRVGSQRDLSQDPAFLGAMANRIYYGPVRFRRESEPYMTLAMAGSRRDYGVIVAQVNLKFIWDVVSQTKVGQRGAVFLVDSQARLIAHPDISLVLRNTDLSHLAHVQAAQAPQSSEPPQSVVASDLQDELVLSAHAAVAPVGWMVFVELPINEAYGPLYTSILRSGALLLAALALAFFVGLFLARRMIVPIETLRDGAARIGEGDLAQRISINTGDELQVLGNQFNDMAAKLQESYENLERKVELRTRQLELANLAKSRFLAAASHDLRQPLHALGLFVAQLRTPKSEKERKRTVKHIDSALVAMNELFSALLDISKLDAGILTPTVTEFSVAQLLKRIETTFRGTAEEKGLSLRIAASSAWVRSDFVLLERILFNLVSNAVRYSSHGGLIVGCRRRDRQLRIEVWDTGVGIPQDQHQNIFSEFYRLGEPDRDRRSGFGLGLAIVDRLCQLLDHPIKVTSTVGKGSRFTVVVPMVPARPEVLELPAPGRLAPDICKGKLLVVIDDDPLVLAGMGGLFRSWGCRVVTGETESTALSGLTAHKHPPDLIISDYQLPEGKSGIGAIERVRRAFCTPIPAFLITGDTNPEALREARANGYHLLHKPVQPMALRAMLNQILRKEQVAHPIDGRGAIVVVQSAMRTSSPEGRQDVFPHSAAPDPSTTPLGASALPLH
jgi:signal transduction histidine kinase/CheY-like chemotaxis protein